MRWLVLLVPVLAACGSDPSAPWDPSHGSGPGTDAGAGADATAAPSGDAGTSSSDAAGPSAPTACTSGQFWTLGDTKSASMHPGVSCRSCHVVLGKASSKDFDISGTVYPTAHEPDDCNGIGGVTVVITDAKNTQHVLQVNAAGNFYHDDSFGLLRIPTPYTAKVVSGNTTREMIASQTNGDCNSCHTEGGAQSAPGRIMAP
jgi:hypothetical protein